jgi:hypothetical protein
MTGFVLPQGTTTFLSPQNDPMVGFARTMPSYEMPYATDAPQGPRGLMDNPIARQKEMAWLKSIGVRVIKIDFFGGDKQVTMKLYSDDEQLHVKVITATMNNKQEAGPGHSVQWSRCNRFCRIAISQC